MFDDTRTGSLLHKDHETTLAALNNLETVLTKHTAKRVPDLDDVDVRTAVREAANCLASEVERHFAFEEQHLFPLLADRGEDSINSFLTEEHAAMTPLVKETVERARAALKDGFDAASWKAFHAIASELIERQVFHIQKEEMVLLAAISSLLDEEADSDLANTYQMMG